MERASDRIRERGLFPEYFGDDTVLVPVPGHAPMREDTVWPAQMIAEALVRWRLAQSWTPILKRTAHIEKSATFSGRRTINRQLETIDAVLTVEPLRRIVVVDDVITSGATLFAVTQMVVDAFPDAAVKAFALVRTLSDGEIPETEDRCLDPVVGTITLNSDGTTTREP